MSAMNQRYGVGKEGCRFGGRWGCGRTGKGLFLTSSSSLSFGSIHLRAALALRDRSSKSSSSFPRAGHFFFLLGPLYNKRDIVRFTGWCYWYESSAIPDEAWLSLRRERAWGRGEACGGGCVGLYGRGKDRLVSPSARSRRYISIMSPSILFQRGERVEQIDGPR